MRPNHRTASASHLALTVTYTVIVLMLGGCAAAKTTIPKPNERCDDDGLVYHLPARRFILSVTVDKTGHATGVTAQATDPIPDLAPDRRFCATLSKNWFAKNTLDFGVTTSGLLTAANAEFESKIGEALKAAAKSAGSISALATSGAPSTCTAASTHSTIVNPGTTTSEAVELCGVKFTIRRLGSGSHDADPNVPTTPASYSGVFYREDQPYQVDAEASSGLRYSAILMAPNASPIRFLPMETSVFADSTSQMTFSGGMPQKYKQAVASEAVGALSIPADVIDAYFSSLGSIFEKIGGARSKEADLDKAAATQADNEVKRLLAEEKLHACRQAIASKDQLKILSACQ